MAQDSKNPMYSGISQLSKVEENLENYNQFIVKKILNWIPNRNRLTMTMDFGAGSGSLAAIFRAETGISPICVEIDPKLTKLLREGGFKHRNNLSGISNYFDFAYSSNVLEHIEKDQLAINEIFNSLTPGAYFAIYVPAFELLFSKMDESVGHVRRYSKSELVKKVRNADFTIVNVEFVDSIGFFASLLARVLKFDSTSSTGSSSALRIYDRWVFPVSRTLDLLGFKRILGKNLFLVARKDPVS